MVRQGIQRWKPQITLLSHLWMKTLSSYIHLNFKPHLDKCRISTILNYTESQIYVVLLCLHCSAIIRDYIVKRGDVSPIILVPLSQAKRGKNGRFSILLLIIYHCQAPEIINKPPNKQKPISLHLVLNSDFQNELILPWFFSWHFPWFFHTSNFLIAAEKERAAP